MHTMHTQAQSLAQQVNVCQEIRVISLEYSQPTVTSDRLLYMNSGNSANLDVVGYEDFTKVVHLKH